MLEISAPLGHDCLLVSGNPHVEAPYCCKRQPTVRRLLQAHPLAGAPVFSATRHLRLSYPRYRYEAEHLDLDLDLGRPIGRR